MIFLLLAQAAAPLPATPQPAPPADPALAARYERCLDLATDDPERAIADAGEWATGGYFARQCRGMAYAHLDRWAAAAAEFGAAAQAAEIARDARAARYWAQAGNAWLAGGDAAQARAALDAALASGALEGLALGEARFDRARALVLLGDEAGARRDIDAALKTASADPLLWLASATLARRSGDLARAKADAIEAYKRSSDDPSVLLEIGNIAYAGGDRAGAASAWRETIARRPGSDPAKLAEERLRALGEVTAAKAEPR
ncbi:MAG: hypothetical protein K2X76_01450 [Sphingomonas sp.]|nr:hypothetical protein [Sphingomonas sp.]